MRRTTADTKRTKNRRPTAEGFKRAGLGILVAVLIATLADTGLHQFANAAVRHRSQGVKIASPQRRTTVHGTIVVDGTASGGSGVRSVRIRVSGLPHSRRATGTKHWTYTLDTTLLTDGPHTIKARVLKRHPHKTDTTTIDINVANADAPPPPPAQPIVLGIWSDGVKGHTTGVLESQIGRLFGGMRYNYKFLGTVPAKPGNISFDSGRSVFYNNAESQDLNSRPIAWADIAAGRYDDHLAEIVRAFGSNSRWTNANPYLFSFHHEQDVAKGFGTYGTPADYKAAFRHIFDYFHDAGILWRDGGQVKMVWDVTRYALNSGSAENYDPDLSNSGSVIGDYYDILGVDLYDKVQLDGHLGYTNPHTAFDPAHEYALDRGKQFGVFELGVSEGKPGEKAAFLSRIPSTLRSYGSGVPGSAMALMYSNVTGKQVYYADSSEDSLAAFIKMANDPLFAS